VNRKNKAFSNHFQNALPTTESDFVKSLIKTTVDASVSALFCGAGGVRTKTKNDVYKEY